ncbi:MAG: glycoside hydrolase [Gemmatimonadaceae bacterium]
MRLRSVFPALFALASTPIATACAQSIDPSMYSTLQYRLIGPFRGGRTVGAAGIPDQPNVFYVGATDGGVWKTTDAGRTWDPIFDAESTGSIGTIAIAPSDPNVIYVGSGEGLRRPDLSTGDGIYKSSDAGKTWRHLGLRDGQQIAQIIVDPRNPNRLLVAVLGHPYGPNAERGIFRSTDGGETWAKVLYKDENTGGVDLAFDPTNAQTVYAALWASRRPPWTAANPYDGDGSGLFKSTDGGTTWHQLTQGLPTRPQGLGRIGFTVAPDNPNRMYALVDAKRGAGGLFRSDDAGNSWTRVNDEERISGRGNDFAWVRADPRNADEIYVCNTSTYRSMDGGKTFTAIKGAPGGDDYHAIWINPLHPEILLLAVDQGATISVNGGKTWSSWYNQPTAQLYHVTTDNRYPYWVYGGQQESGSAAVASRGNDGAITFREFHPVGTEEYGYAAPDPLDSNNVFGGKVTRFDWVTGQNQSVAPEAVRGGKYRFDRTAPLIFSYADPHSLFLGSNVLFKTRDGGHSWDIISPDLTRDSPPAPATLGEFVSDDPAHGLHRGVIYSIAPSYHDANVVWIGTDDGLIQLTRDGGKTWNNITPSTITPWSKIAQLDASHFDENTVYAAVNRFRLDDLKPHIYRTHDGGKSWKEIDDGLPDNSPVNVVREDPVRKGLLFAGTENTVYASFDDGDHWEPLRQNLPASSVRDLVVKDSDLVVATHGRSFWILDDITPLRQLSAQTSSEPAHLFAPAGAFRVDRDTYTDTPMPPEEPVGQNPPDGAIIDYYIGGPVNGAVTLEVLDANGKLVRRYSSADRPDVTEKEIDALNVPAYWIRRPRILPASAGMHRWIWNLHYPDPSVLTHEYPISAIYMDTPRLPLGPVVLPGTYTVRLTVNGKSYTQPLVVKMDPRVHTPAADLQQQFALATHTATMIEADFTAITESRALQKGLQDARSPANGANAHMLPAIDSMSARIKSLSITRLNGELSGLLRTIDGVDARPTTQATAAVAAIQQSLDTALSEWTSVKGPALSSLNARLKTAGMHIITIPADLTPYRTSLQQGETADKDDNDP